MLKLLVNNPEQSDAVLPLRWCLTSDTVEKLKGVIDKEPRILIAVVRREGKQNYEVDRGLMKIDQLMDYIQFSKHGNYTVYAAIVYLEKYTLDNMQKVCLSKKREHDYEYNIFDGSWRFRKDYLEDHGVSVLEHTSIDIVVGKEFFAKEPAEWEKSWVNLFYSSKYVDECGFRRRRMFAYSLQPFLVVVFSVIITVIKVFGSIFFLLCGYRGIDLEPILHPFKNDVNDVWYYHKDSIFTKDNDGNQKPIYYWLFAPVAWVSIFALVALAKWAFHTPVVLPFISLASSFILVVFLLNYLQSSVKREFDLYKKHLEEERKKRLEEERNRLFDDVVCDYSPGFGVKDLPKHRQTVYLRFMELKSKICRPFAQ